MSGVIRVGGHDELPEPQSVPRRSAMDFRGLPPPPKFVSDITGPRGLRISDEDAFTHGDIDRLSSSLDDGRQLVPAATDEELRAAYESGRQDVLEQPGYGEIELPGGIHVRHTQSTTTDYVVESARPGVKLPVSLMRSLGAIPFPAQLPQLPSQPAYETYIPAAPTEAVSYNPPSQDTDLSQQDGLSEYIFGQSQDGAKPDVKSLSRKAKQENAETNHRFLRASAIILAPLLAGGLAINNWSNFNDGMHYLGKETGLAKQGTVSFNMGTLKEAAHIFIAGDTTNKG